ncbi:O-acyltransferase WSD1 [Morus notabilis]|uniref:O-acyltransferase WSD1 n=1 Tax=Morus notabilis TaxID=981085 RepID=W9RLM7_9ROSA|nr:O-acyltransferase WSD1 [Morus notabilis]
METPPSEEESRKMKLSPAARLFQSPRFNCYIVSIIGCNSTIDPEVIKDGLTRTLFKHPRFSSKLVVDDGKFCRRRRWVRTPVNLDDHVFIRILGSKIENPDQFVEDYISHLTTTPLDLSKPLWELHLLNLKTSDSESLGIFRIHHSVGDGASLMSLLLACTRRTSDPDALPTLPAPSKRPPPPDSGDFSVRFLRFLMAIWSVITLIWNTFVDVTVFAATILFLSDSKTPIKGPPGVELSTKRFVHRSISLGDIKFVKNAMNTTINDVLLGVTQAGLSRYLNRRYAQIEKDEGTNKKTNFLPKKIRLSSTVLVNLRPTVGIQALTDMMAKNSKAKWGNLLGYLLLPFNIALQDDPLDYVRQAKATIDRKKHSLEAICTYLCARFLQKIFGVEPPVRFTYVRRRARGRNVAGAGAGSKGASQQGITRGEDELAGPMAKLAISGGEFSFNLPSFCVNLLGSISIGIRACSSSGPCCGMGDLGRGDLERPEWAIQSGPPSTSVSEAWWYVRILVESHIAKITAATARRAISNTTVAFSNMMGPLEEVSFYGHQISYLAPSVYGHPHALTIHFQSYVDKMTIILAVDPNVIPDPQQLFDDFEDSLKLICEAVIKQGLNKETV